METASVARQGEIGSVVGTVVFAGTNVVDVEGSERRIALGKAAVFAATLSALPHQSTDRGVHSASGCCAVGEDLPSFCLED